MHILTKLASIAKLEVRPVANHKAGFFGESKGAANKQAGAYDTYSYNISNNLLNKPTEFTEAGKKEAKEALEAFSYEYGLEVNKFNHLAPDNILVGKSGIKVKVGNEGLTLYPMTNPQDLLKAVILLGNESVIAFGREKIGPSTAYLMSEPDKVVNTKADDFATHKQLMKFILNLTTKEALQDVLEVYSLITGGINRMNPDQPQPVLDAKIAELVNDKTKAAKLLSVFEDKDLDFKIKLSKYICSKDIVFKAGSGYELPETSITPKNFQGLFNYLSKPENSRIMAGLATKSLTKQVEAKKPGRPAKAE